MAVRVDVVIITWNDGFLLQNAVESVLASIDVECRVFIVDNGSDPPAPTPLDRRVRLLRSSTNLGVARARNLGASSTDAPFLAFLDSDARFDANALRRLLKPLVHEPDVALTAPVFTDQRPEASAGRAPGVGRKLARALNVRDQYVTTENAGIGDWWDVDFAIGACQVMRRVAFDAVGGLDDRYFYGPEDVDFCLRLKKAGWRIAQVGNAACHHPARRRFRGLSTPTGARHALGVARHLWRHRHFAA